MTAMARILSQLTLLLNPNRWAMRAEASKFLTPIAVARRLGVRDSKVFGWIRSGESRAFNFAERACRHPCYKISEVDLAAFLAMRAASVTNLPAARQRRQRPENV